MPQHHTTADQVVFVGEWFRSWSEMQRKDFLPSLVRELRPSLHINGDVNEQLNALSLAASNRPPSIFHCQVKLFHDWVGSWSSEERAKLLSLLRQDDGEFADTLDKTLAALDDASPQEPAAAEAPGAAQPEVVAAPVVAQPPAAVESDVDEALDSSPSSTLSSPRPSDGHPDSGLDSPVGGEVVDEEDEGGHVVIMDDVAGVDEQENNVGGAADRRYGGDGEEEEVQGGDDKAAE